MAWAEERDPIMCGIRFCRHDGAVVKYAMGPRKMDWIAYEPDPSAALGFRKSRNARR